MQPPQLNDYILKNVLEIDLGPMPVYWGKLYYEGAKDWDHVTLTRRMRDGSSWAIENHSCCLNKDGEFEYESLPSNRPDDFLVRCRYASLEEAYEFFQRWREWIIQKFYKGIAWGTNTWDNEKFMNRDEIRDAIEIVSKIGSQNEHMEQRRQAVIEMGQTWLARTDQMPDPILASYRQMVSSFVEETK